MSINIIKCHSVFSLFKQSQQKNKQTRENIENINFNAYHSLGFSIILQNNHLFI